MAEQAPVAEQVPSPAIAGRPRVNRRDLLGAAGLAGLGGALGLGYLLRDRGAAALGGDRARAAHLLRRAGFAPTAAEIDTAVRDGLAATTDRLLHPERVPDARLEARLAAAAYDTAKPQPLRMWWITRMAYSERPLLEKATLFWHGLLTSSFRKVAKSPEVIRTQNDFLRAHALGKLRDILVGISKDAAMLHWLDGTGSGKAHPNENYARELMELFTMGVGNYTETDVREAARALTGWVVDAGGAVAFRPRIHDGGVKTFLGRTGNLGLEEVVDTILATSAAPLYISRRLWSFFAYPGVDDATLKPVVDAYHRGGGDVREMIGAILTHPAFYSTTAYRGIVKSPTELVVGLIRQHGLPVTTLAADAGDAMGQALFDPPDVAGWPGGPSWLNTGSWMARMRYLEAQTRAGAGAIQAGFTAAGATTAEAIVDRAAGYMVDGALTPAARDAIVAHVRSAGGTTAGAAADAVFLVGATPEHQLS